MAYNPFMGSAGRGKTVIVAANLALPLPTLTGTTAAVNGLRSWKRSASVQSEGMTQFEGTATASGLITTEQLQGGTVAYTVQLSGYFDGDTTDTGVKFAEGAFVKWDFILNKTSAQGYYAVYGKITALEYGSEISGKANEFTATVAVHGAWPALSTS